MAGVPVPNGEEQCVRLRLGALDDLRAFCQIDIQCSLRVRIEWNQAFLRGQPAHAALPMNENATLLRAQVSDLYVGSLRNSQPRAIQKFEDKPVAFRERCRKLAIEQNSHLLLAGYIGQGVRQPGAFDQRYLLMRIVVRNFFVAQPLGERFECSEFSHRRGLGDSVAVKQ